MVATAADIPEEIFERIVLNVAGHAAYMDNSIAWSREQKHAVSNCSLVCRYWCRLARETLFRTVTLRSPKDLYDFAAILDCPTPIGLEPVSYIALYIYAEPSLTDEPWLHLMPALVLSKLTSPGQLYVDGSRLAPQNGGPWLHSLHPFVPRRLPNHYSPCSMVNLIAVHFKDASGLARLLSGLPKVYSITLAGLTWDTKPDENTIVTNYAMPLQSSYTLYVRCSEDLSAVWFLPTLMCTFYPDAPHHSARVSQMTKRKKDVPRYLVDAADYQTAMELFLILLPKHDLQAWEWEFRIDTGYSSE